MPLMFPGFPLKALVRLQWLPALPAGRVVNQRNFHRVEQRDMRMDLDC